jgi:outer membrane protein assembly factor BamB
MHPNKVSMFRLSIISALLIIAGLGGTSNRPALAQSNPEPQPITRVRLHWGARRGVSRYRFQLAGDRDFRDIIIDRVINGTETNVDDLPPGRYFWRIAPLTQTLGEYSSAAIVEVSEATTVREPDVSGPATPVVGQPPRPVTITTTGGWRAAVGDVARPVIAHLRSRDNFEIVATNSNGVTFALDSMSGVQLWTTRARRGLNVPAASASPPLIIPSASGLDDVVVFDGLVAIKIEGKSGRELWRTPLSNLPSSAVVGIDIGTPVIAVIDNSLRRMVVLNGANGQIISRTSLKSRVAGPPAASLDQHGQFFIAYESGDIELRDKAGAVIRSGSAASKAITGPLLVRSRRDAGNRGQDMILVETRDGLTGITASDLKPVGRVTSKQEVSGGALIAADLNDDGHPEVFVTTPDGYLLAIHGEDGKLLWDTTVRDTPQGMAFADLDGDGIKDVIITTANSFAIALSGRDGSPIWKDPEPTESIPKYALQGRGLVAVPLRSSVLIVAGDAAHTGLRAIEFPKTTGRR